MPNIDKESENSGLTSILSFIHALTHRRLILFLVFTASVVAIIVAAGWPVTTLETPRWEVWVVDGSGHATEGMTVRMPSQNYSAESIGREQDLYTDASGHVVFPARTLTASPLNRAFAWVRAAQLGVHASFGGHVSLFAFGGGREGFTDNFGEIIDWTGQPAEMESCIVVS